MRTAIRTLVALTLLAWGQFAWAIDFTWWIRGAQSHWDIPYSSADAACEGWARAWGRTYISKAPTTPSQSNATAAFTCKAVDARNRESETEVFRQGMQCPVGTSYNAAIGSCEGARNCKANQGKEIYAAVECRYQVSTRYWACPSEVSFDDGCSYVTAPNGNLRCNSATSICTPRFIGTGEEASSAAEACSSSTCAPVPQNTPPMPDEGCVTNGGNTVCIKDEQAGCGTVNGQAGCFSEEKNCGTFNGTFRCFDQEKPNRNCGYADGQQICFDPNDPTRQIPPSSADHPINGGNADGIDTNDPRPSAGTGTSRQGSGEGATNQAIEDLGEKLGPKIDKTNSLLTDIRGKFDELLDGLFGEGYDESGSNSDGDAEAAGKGAGDALAEQIGQQAAQLLGERDAEVHDALKGLPDTVTHGWFGTDGAKVGLNNVLDRLLPSAMGCASYSIPLNLGRYSTTLVLPVCELTRLKPLLEYIIWIVTAVGLWKILYAALRQEDAKAAKGGF